MNTPKTEECRQAYLKRPLESGHDMLVWKLAETLELENIRLRDAIREHMDTFPDEACEGERKLWSVIISAER